MFILILRNKMLRLKTLRVENNLSQRAVALKIGSSQKSVDYWEK
ncbi:MAG: helix-turn-helix domain-containing protein, partial [Clostridia bacterium]|nr:helix-turn-helix domain-containing protein [Clostridia bacterium]